MTTATFSAFGLRIPNLDSSGTYSDFLTTALTARFRDDAMISYDVLSQTSDGRALVDLDLTGTYDLALDGALLPYLMIFTVQSHLFQINWPAGDATLMTFDLDLGLGGDGDHIYWRLFVQVDGTPLPDIQSLQQAETFFNTVTLISPPESASGLLEWPQFTGAIETQNDRIDPLDQLRLFPFGNELDTRIDAGAGEGDLLDLSIDPDGVTVDLSQNMLTGYNDRSFTVLNFEHVMGSRGDDTLIGDTARNQFRGMAGNDVIEGGADLDTARYDLDPTGVQVDLSLGTAIDGWGGTDSLSGIERVIGSDVSDSLTGDDSRNVIKGRDGDDTINGLGGNDDLHGDDGHDNLRGGNGMDELYGGLGRDTLNGQAGNDQMYGGAGRDTLNGGAGWDHIQGGGGQDLITGGRGQDILHGGEGADEIHGNRGNDDIDGGQGHDRLLGGNGDDDLVGGQGDDRLKGGNGDDGLDGGAGTNVLTGGAGRDTFYFREGVTRITDFQDDIDTIILNDWLQQSTEIEDVLAFGRIEDGNAVFDFGNGWVLTVEGVTDLSIFENDLFAYH